MVFSAAWSTVTACRVPVALTSGSLLIQAILQDVIAVVIALAGFFPAKMSVEAIGTYFGVTVASQKKAFKTTVMHVFDHLRQQHAPQPLVFMTRQQRPSSRCKGRGEKWLGVGATLTAHSQHSRNAAGSRHNESQTLLFGKVRMLIRCSSFAVAGQTAGFQGLGPAANRRL